MDERDLEPEQALARRCVDQLGARVREPREGRPQVADLVRHVVHARASVSEEATHWRVLAQGLEQLDAALPDPHRSSTHTLIIDGRAVFDLRSEETLVGCQRLVEVGDGHAEMMDAPGFHPGEANGMD